MRILLIEDDKFFVNFYSIKLTEQGFEVFTASDGDEGIVKIEQIKPNVILLDLIMPKKDGFQVLSYLKSNQAVSNIPVIVFSTLGQEEDVKRAKDLGARDYVNKSLFDFDSLMNKITTYTR